MVHWTPPVTNQRPQSTTDEPAHRYSHHNSPPSPFTTITTLFTAALTGTQPLPVIVHQMHHKRYIILWPSTQQHAPCKLIHLWAVQFPQSPTETIQFRISWRSLSVHRRTISEWLLFYDYFQHLPLISTSVSITTSTTLTSSLSLTKLSITIHLSDK